jgi:hypothetical protein
MMIEHKEYVFLLSSMVMVKVHAKKDLKGYVGSTFPSIIIYKSSHKSNDKNLS